MNLYALPSIIAFVVNAILAVYVLGKNPKGRANRAYSLLILFVGIWLFGEFMTGIADNDRTAWLWSRFFMSGVVFIPAAFLYFSQVFPYETELGKDRKWIYAVFAFSSIFFVLVLATDLVIGDVVMMYYGYDQETGGAYPAYVAFFFICIIYGLYSLYQRRRSYRTSIEREQISYVLLGTFSPTVIGGFVDLLVPLLGINSIPTLASTFTIFMAVFLGYAVVKYHLMIVEPVYECDYLLVGPRERKMEIEPGRVYLIKEPTEFLGLDIFADEVSHCVQGLCITSKDTETVRGKYELKKTPVITANDGDQKNLERLEVTIRRFIKDAEEGIVIVDGLETLVTSNSLKSVSKIVDSLLGDLENSGSSLLMSLNPAELRPDEIRQLEETLAVHWLDSIFKSVSNPIRRDILNILTIEPKPFKELTRLLDMTGSPPKLSFHLNQLKRSGLVIQDEEKNYLLGNRGLMVQQIFDDTGMEA